MRAGRLQQGERRSPGARSMLFGRRLCVQARETRFERRRPAGSFVRAPRGGRMRRRPPIDTTAQCHARKTRPAQQARLPPGHPPQQGRPAAPRSPYPRAWIDGMDALEGNPRYQKARRSGGGPGLGRLSGGGPAARRDVRPSVRLAGGGSWGRRRARAGALAPSRELGAPQSGQPCLGALRGAAGGGAAGVQPATAAAEPAAAGGGGSVCPARRTCPVAGEHAAVWPGRALAAAGRRLADCSRSARVCRLARRRSRTSAGEPSGLLCWRWTGRRGSTWR